MATGEQKAVWIVPSVEWPPNVVTFLQQVRLLQVTRSNMRSFSNVVNIFSVWDLYTSWRWVPVELNAFLLLTPTEIYKDVILQIKPFNNDNKPSCKTAFASLELQLQPCPAPPLMAPRWLADRSLQDGASCSRTHGAHVWGMWKPRLAWQPGRTLHHRTKMKSVTSWPVFQLPIRTPSLGLSFSPSGGERQVLKHPQPQSSSVLMSPARSVSGGLWSWLELCSRTERGGLRL